MSYYFTRVVEVPFDTAIERVTGALKTEGFGILTQIDVQQTMKEKLNVDFRRYRILGACNPPFAWKALQAEERIGTLLPCNVIVQETPRGEIEVSVVDPVSSMQAVDNAQLRPIAQQVQEKLRRVLAAI
jgi:uncharacterized protein (DUF302 family)